MVKSNCCSCNRPELSSQHQSWQFITACKSSSRRSDIFYWCLQAHTQAHIDAHSYIKKLFLNQVNDIFTSNPNLTFNKLHSLLERSASRKSINRESTYHLFLKSPRVARKTDRWLSRKRNLPSKSDHLNSNSRIHIKVTETLHKVLRPTHQIYTQ